MAQNAELLHHRALQGEDWAGCFKYRVGDYRIIYQVDWATQTAYPESWTSSRGVWMIRWAPVYTEPRHRCMPDHVRW